MQAAIDGLKNVEEFATALEALCEQHENEDSFYFDYEESEEDFDITPDDEEAFLAALEALCEKISNDNGYSWD